MPPPTCLRNSDDLTAAVKNIVRAEIRSEIHCVASGGQISRARIQVAPASLRALTHGMAQFSGLYDRKCGFLGWRGCRGRIDHLAGRIRDQPDAQLFSAQPQLSESLPHSPHHRLAQTIPGLALSHPTGSPRVTGRKGFQTPLQATTPRSITRLLLQLSVRLEP